MDKISQDEDFQEPCHGQGDLNYIEWEDGSISNVDHPTEYDNIGYFEQY